MTVGIAAVAVIGIMYYMKKKKEKETIAYTGKAEGATVTTKPAVADATSKLAQQACEAEFAHIRISAEGRARMVAECMANQGLAA